MDNDSVQNTVSAELDPWDDPVLFQDDLLRVRFKIPRDWQVERTPDRPLSFIAPARGNPPFQALITIMVQPVPPLGAGLLPLVAEQIFSTENDTSLPQFEAQPAGAINLGHNPAMLHKCSWQQEGGSYQGKICKTTLVSQAWNRLYIVCLYMNEELSELAFEVFKVLLFSISFGEIDEPGPPEEPVSKVLEKQRNSEPEPTQAAKFVEGRWGSRKH